MEQANFIHYPLVKAFEKQKKQVKSKEEKNLKHFQSMETIS